MAKAALTLPTTQRAYTLRLRGIDPSDHSWRDALWATHEAVNNGAKVFGEWLLTLRGGLDHNLADQPIKGRGNATTPPTEAERRNRRILLALSWLSVENAQGAPQDDSLIVARGTDSADCRVRKLAGALTAILQGRGVNASEVGDPNQPFEDQPGSWLGDCMPSLSAAIREDAVWVNRSKAFDTANRLSLTCDEIWDFLEPFFASADAYLKAEQAESDDADSVSAVKEEKAKDLVQKAGGWLSKRFGAGTGADFARMAEVYSAISGWARQQGTLLSGPLALESLAKSLTSFQIPSHDADGILKLISGPGYKSATRNSISAWNQQSSVIESEAMIKLAEAAASDVDKCNSKTGGKGRRQYSDAILKDVEEACGFTYLQTDGAARHREFSVMLDHAARRVNVAHSWIKNAEAERRQFESDARCIESVPHGALQWLRAYCTDRAGSSGALGAYRLRRRAIDGWDKVVERWSHSDCRSVEDRVAAARQLQDDPEIDKFGDIQLFEALAADDAMCVWKPDGAANAQPLKEFVTATEAEAKKKRFKVPAYRHPDPLRHPVFADFGNSRWDIEYSSHRAPARLDALRQKLEKQKVSVADAERKLDAAKESRRASLQVKVDDAKAKRRGTQSEVDAISDPCRVELTLWNGRTVAQVPMHWSSKRLIADLAIRDSHRPSGDGRVSVSRADRLGRAARSVGEDCPVSITGLFDQEHWNGRLQAPRTQLDSIADHVDKHGWDAKARKLINRIRWLISFSAELSQQGPWTEYCERFDEDAPAKPFVSRKGEYAVKHSGNDHRQGHAKLILSRLPGLRILAVDLGHRYAAACAVWEAISSDQMLQACAAAGESAPDPHAVFIHLNGMNSRGKPGTTIYRRIGSDSLPNGTPHPAPWARLDRQFLIKLQGEDRPARAASQEETRTVEDFEQWAGLRREQSAASHKRAVDLLMSDAVRTARLAIARHGRRGRIAFQMTASVRMLPGGRQQPLDDAGRNELLTDALADWHALATDIRWEDESARQLWNKYLASLNGRFQLAPPGHGSQTEPERTRAQRRQAEQELRQRLAPLAEVLASNLELRQQLHLAWADRWNADDQQWRAKLKWLSRWLMPRGGSKRDASRRHVGGLSLMRISTLTEFRRKVQVGYFTRLRPDGTKAEIGRSFGQSTLDAIQRLKDQRVKQLASRIVEAALGIGCERRGANGHDLPRPRASSPDPTFASCHAVVIENLSHYRPEETRTRRENRATMDWKSAETRKRLADHCQLYGLHLRDVNPQYTSRQDSRTGAPGMRCVDVMVADFLTKPWWRKQVEQVQKKSSENKGDARDRFLLELENRWANASDAERARAGPLRVPMSGGELFVSADRQSPLAAGIQADLNAAANIGLRALMDPDFPGKWWYVPCHFGTNEPHAEKVKGSILQGVGPLAQVERNGQSGEARPSRGRSGRATRKKEVVNLWRDTSAAQICGANDAGSWSETPAYWNAVKVRVMDILRIQMKPDGK